MRITVDAVRALLPPQTVRCADPAHPPEGLQGPSPCLPMYLRVMGAAPRSCAMQNPPPYREGSV